MAEEYLGAVKLFAGTFAPRGYALCQGATLSIAQNSALFALLGTIYGGNGISTFQLPNLAGRVPIGQGQGQNLSNRMIGETGGLENVALQQSTLPSHSHVLNAATNPTTTSTAGFSVLTGGLKAGDPTFYVGPGEPGFATVSLAAGAVSTQGSGVAHNNIQTSLGIIYIIAMQGIFPSRN
jgi:microcystin-dependent protein